MSRMLSQKAAAEELGLTARQVHNLTEKGMPRTVENGKPLYPFPEAMKWYIAFKVSSELASAEPLDFEKAKARKMAADAELAHLELAKTRGEQIELSEVRKTWERAASRIRAQLLAAPGRYSPRVVGLDSLPAAQRALDAIVRDVLTELKDDGHGIS